jgi:hypothetical protein
VDTPNRGGISKGSFFIDDIDDQVSYELHSALTGHGHLMNKRNEFPRFSNQAGIGLNQPITAM